MTSQWRQIWYVWLIEKNIPLDNIGTALATLQQLFQQQDYEHSAPNLYHIYNLDNFYGFLYHFHLGHIFDTSGWSKPCLDISSFSLASAIRWLRQVAHMRWPFLHCHKLTLGISRHTVQEQWRLILSRISFGDSAVGIFRPEEDDDSSSVFISFFIFEGGGSKCSFIGSSRKYLLGTTSHYLQKLRPYNL